MIVSLVKNVTYILMTQKNTAHIMISAIFIYFLDS